MNVDLLLEYLSLGYKVGNRSIGLKDKLINPTTLLRSTKEGDTIYYLTSGNSLFIPYHWIDLFDGLYLYNGDQILFTPYLGKDYMEDFIYVWMKFEKEKSLDSLTDLCILGTEKFRTWIKDTYKVKFYPFKLTTGYNDILEL